LIEADNNCSVNAVCTDTVGGYNCTCTIGFEGDGLTCFSKSHFVNKYNGFPCSLMQLIDYVMCPITDINDSMRVEHYTLARVYS